MSLYHTISPGSLALIYIHIFGVPSLVFSSLHLTCLIPAITGFIATEHLNQSTTLREDSHLAGLSASEFCWELFCAVWWDFQILQKYNMLNLIYFKKHFLLLSVFKTIALLNILVKTGIFFPQYSLMNWKFKITSLFETFLFCNNVSVCYHFWTI